MRSSTGGGQQQPSLDIELATTSHTRQGLRVLYSTAIYDDRGQAVIPDESGDQFNLPAGESSSFAHAIPSGLPYGFYYLEAIAGWDNAGRSGTTLDRLYFLVNSDGIDLVDPEDWVQQSNIGIAHRGGV